MIEQVRYLGLLFLILLGINTVAFSQNFKYNTTQKGVNLPIQNVLQVDQDSLGRMWFSTVRGVYYSDGIQTHALPDSIVSKFEFRIAIHIDEDGIVWLYNQNGLPRVFKGGYGKWEEEVLPIDFGNKQSNRIVFFSMGKGNEKQFFLDNETVLITWKTGGNNFQQLPRPDYVNSGRLFSVTKFQGKDHYFFEKMAVQDDGGQFNPILFEGLKLPSNPIIVKRSPFSGNFYFLGKDYLAKGPDFHHPMDFADSNISESDFVSESNFGLFFNSDNVFYFFNSQLKKIGSYNRFPLILDLKNQLNIFYINSAFTDREGILWIATSRGLVNLNSLKFQNYGRFRVDLMSEEISAILDLGRGDFLFGFNNGIQKFSQMELSTVYRNSYVIGAPQGRIINFSEDPDSGEIWFSANQDGVGKYFPNSDRTSVYRPPVGEVISSVMVSGDSVIMAGPKSVFIAPKTAQGAKLFERNLIDEIQELINQPILFLRKAAKLKDGRIVVMAGKKYIDQPLLQQNDRFVVVQGFDVLETEKGLLIGSDSGLKIFKNNQVSSFELNGQEIENPVYSLLEDSKGQIWLGTDQGVIRINDTEIVRFDESNGLIGNEVNRGAFLESKSGRIIIGTTKGFSIFFPEENFQASGTPKIHLVSYQVGDIKNEAGEVIEVPYSKNSFQAEFIAPGFDESKELWIHYRLLGLAEEEWQIIKDPKSNQLFFNNLPAGEYQLEIKSSYSGVDFSETSFSNPFVILKPFYLQFWFLFITSLFFVAVGILINLIYHQLKRFGVLKAAFDTKEKEKISAEQQFKNVWDSSKDSLILTLDNEEIVAVNPAFAKMIGEKTSSLPGKYMNDLFSDQNFCSTEMQMFAPSNLSRLEEGMTVRTVFPWKSKSLDMELYTKLIQKDYQGHNLVMCIFRDISIEKAIENRFRDAKEKAEEANRFKTSLLSNISHEIRTPLNGILGGTEHIMMSREGDKELLSQLDIILQSGERLLSTINSILDMAKIEANKMEIKYEKVELVTYIKTILVPLKTMAQRKNLVLEEEYPQLSILGNTDKRFLEMILNNLVGNAIKYTNEGHIKLRVEQENSNLLVELSDTGIGMSKDYFKKIFEPFEQESTGNNRLYDGTGLGLSITKNLITMLGGVITIDSQKNAGTVVRLKIPV